VLGFFRRIAIDGDGEVVADLQRVSGCVSDAIRMGAPPRDIRACMMPAFGSVDGWP
jgi:hypothetical protein